MKDVRITIVMMCVVALVPALAGAEIFTVTTDADSGAGSLRQAIKLANSNSEPDEIVFASDYTITLKSPLPYVTSPITIIGNGWDRSVIDGLAVAEGATGQAILRVAATGHLVVDAVMLANSGANPVANGGHFLYLNSLVERTLLKYGGAGAFFFENTTQSVAGDAGSATIRVTRFDGSEGAVAVDYTTGGGTAVAGSDYVATSGTLLWANGQGGAKTFQIPILDNPERMGNVTVNVELSNPTNGSTLGSPSTMVLTILDDGSGGTGIEYAQDGFFVDEDGGSASVVVSRGPGSGAASVDYATEDLSAVAGSDYTSVSGTLTWGSGDTDDKTITVPILNDGSSERSKLVRLTLTNPSGAMLGSRDTSVVVITDDDGSSACSTASGDNLCLLESRFKIETEWRDQRTGNHGLGTAIEESNKSGFVWFFNSVNIELIVKMLDGRPVTGAFWLFYGALSDVEYWIIATDTQTSDVVLYRNVPGDICGLGDTLAFPQSKLAGARVGTPMPMDETLFDYDPVVSFDGSAKVGTCVSDSTTLCLLDNRFEVKVDWEDQRTSNTGVGTVVPGTDNTGSFWFFNNENLELVVKVLNGTPVNGKFWVFYGALSDVIYTITVTDTETSAVKQYVNPAGNICGVGDTVAFDPS